MTHTTESPRAGPLPSAPPAFGTTPLDRLLLAAAAALRSTRRALRWLGSAKFTAARVAHPAMTGASDAELARLRWGVAHHSIDDLRWAAVLAVQYGRPLPLH